MSRVRLRCEWPDVTTIAGLARRSSRTKWLPLVERMPGGQADFRLDTIVQKGAHLQIIGSSLNQQVIADFSRQLEFSNGLFSNVMLSVEGKEVKLDDVLDRKENDKTETPDKPDKKGSDKKDAEKKAEPDAVTARVFQFTIDCDYNKPRAEPDKDKDKLPPAAPGK